MPKASKGLKDHENVKVQGFAKSAWRIVGWANIGITSPQGAKLGQEVALAKSLQLTILNKLIVLLFKAGPKCQSLALGLDKAPCPSQGHEGLLDTK